MLPSRRFAARLAWLVPFVALVYAACDHNPAEPGALATITVRRNPDTLVVSTSRQFTAIGYDANGNVVGINPTWSVAAGGGAINASGVFAAGTVPGTFANTVTATVGSISGTASVTVVAGSAASITVTPTPQNLAVGFTQQFTAVVRDAANNVLTVLPNWSVTAGGGTINATGLFTAGTVAGTYTNTVSASVGPIAGYATVIVLAPPGPPLGAAETHGLLAGSAFTCADGAVPYSTINADASVWPGSAYTGFPPCIITGATHAADAPAQIAQGDLTTAYNALEAMACGTTITADLGGTTLAPGVYCSTSSVGVTGPVTLNGNGDPNALFVIRAASTLTTAGSVILSNGAQAKNVYWWVGSSATLGINSAWQGNIIALVTITMAGNGTLCGRALARNGAVSLDGDNNYIKLPPVAPPTCTFP